MRHPPTSEYRIPAERRSAALASNVDSGLIKLPHRGVHMPPVLRSQVRRLLASVPVILLLTALSPALAQQKPAAPSPRSQAQLEDRVKQLERPGNDAAQKPA